MQIDDQISLFQGKVGLSHPIQSTVLSSDLGIFSVCLLNVSCVGSPLGIDGFVYQFPRSKQDLKNCV